MLELKFDFGDPELWIRFAFNRTMLELKCLGNVLIIPTLATFNRTMLELK